MAMDTQPFTDWLQDNYDAMLAAVVRCSRDPVRAEGLLGEALGDLLDVPRLWEAIVVAAGGATIRAPGQGGVREYDLVDFVTRRACHVVKRYFDKQRGQDNTVLSSGLPAGMEIADRRGDRPVYEACAEIERALDGLAACLRKIRAANVHQYLAVIHCTVCGGELEDECRGAVDPYATRDQLDAWRRRSPGSRKSDCSHGRAALRRCLMADGVRFRDLDRRLPPCCPSTLSA